MLKKISFTLAVSSFVLFSATCAYAATSLSGYAWSSNIGWLSFNPSDGATVQLSTTTGSSVGSLSGDAWSPNIGWVSFDRAVTGNPPTTGTADPGNGSGAIATVNMTTGAVNGWARAIAGCQSDLWNGTNCTGTGPGDDNGVSSTGSSIDFTNSTASQLTSAGNRNWSSITSSSDGTKLAAVDYGGYIYVSTTSGSTWTQITAAGVGNWRKITSSSDGTKLVAAVYGGYIYTSTTTGSTWTPVTSAGSQNWYSVAISSDGTKLAAAPYGGYIYMSTTSGSTWTPLTSAGSQNWSKVVLSPDGTKLAAAPYGGYIYMSTTSGSTWTPLTSAGSQNWTSIAMSSDGTKLVATVWGGYIYMSTTSGSTWTPVTSAGSQNWHSVTSSSDGTKLAADIESGYIYTSTTTGSTWTPVTSAGSQNWYGIVSSFDGSKIFISPYPGYLEEISYATTPSTSNTGWDGWIELSGTGHATVTGLTGTATSSAGVSFNTSNNQFSGYAWGSDVVGWLSFNSGSSTTSGTSSPVCLGNNCVTPPTSPTPILSCTNGTSLGTVPAGGGSVTASANNVSVSGGTSPYKYSWNPNSTVGSWTSFSPSITTTLSYPSIAATNTYSVYVQAEDSANATSNQTLCGTVTEDGTSGSNSPTVGFPELWLGSSATPPANANFQQTTNASGNYLTTANIQPVTVLPGSSVTVSYAYPAGLLSCAESLTLPSGVSSLLSSPDWSGLLLKSISGSTQLQNLSQGTYYIQYSCNEPSVAYRYSNPLMAALHDLFASNPTPTAALSNQIEIDVVPSSIHEN